MSRRSLVGSFSREGKMIYDKNKIIITENPKQRDNQQERREIRYILKKINLFK
jgi:hypothetical protein